jgi:hypothetical protein
LLSASHRGKKEATRRFQFEMVLGSPVKRRAVKGPLGKAGPAAAAALAALLLLVCAASLRRSPAFGSALAAAPRKLWAGGVSIASAREGEECDLFDGKWVWDDGRPLYGSADCPFMDAGFRCAENGRPDSSYTKWRWQPARCDLPTYVASPRHPSHYITLPIWDFLFRINCSRLQLGYLVKAKTLGWLES